VAGAKVEDEDVTGDKITTQDGPRVKAMAEIGAESQ